MAKVIAKKTSTTKKILEGALAGAVLGVAAGMFINSTKGKEIQKDIKHKTAEFYKSVAPKVKKMKQMTEVEFKAFMKEAVAKYGKAKKMTEVEINELIKETQQGWKHIARHF